MKALFFLITLFLPVDGWPLGASFLREFGVRPSNFFLLLALVSLTLKKYKYKNIGINIKFIEYKKIFFIFAVGLTLNFAALLINFLFNIIDEVQLVKGFLQLLLVLWFCISIYLWVYLFLELKIDSTGYRYFISCIMLCTFLSLIFFILDFCNINVSEVPGVNSILFFFRGEHDVRTSGLSSEPSTYASWVLLIWPLLILTKKRFMNGVSFFLPIIIGVICLISGLISGSRTFLLIFLFQLALAIFLIIRNSHLKFRILSVTVGIFFLSATIFGGNYEYYLSQISSIFDIENSYSTMTRLGIAYAAFNMFIDNWISGVGIGQFTYHFAKYVPDWALFSPEVQAYISGDIEHRINAFNLFLRVGSEMGFIAFFSFVYFIFKLLKSALFLIENNKNEKLWSIGILISSIGGLSYWMQQDLFSYQPGIFSIALILYLTENTNTENHG